MEPLPPHIHPVELGAASHSRPCDYGLPPAPGDYRNGFFLLCRDTAETLTKLAETRADIKFRFDELQSLLLSRKFKSVRAEEYARQGLGRRLDEMNRAIDFIFDIVPPEQEEPPEVDNRVVTTMLLHGFGSMKPTREAATGAS